MDFDFCGFNLTANEVSVPLVQAELMPANDRRLAIVLNPAGIAPLSITFGPVPVVSPSVEGTSRIQGLYVGVGGPGTARTFHYRQYGPIIHNAVWGHAAVVGGLLQIAEITVNNPTFAHLDGMPCYPSYGYSFWESRINMGSPPVKILESDTRRIGFIPGVLPWGPMVIEDSVGGIIFGIEGIGPNVEDRTFLYYDVGPSIQQSLFFRRNPPDTISFQFAEIYGQF